MSKRREDPDPSGPESNPTAGFLPARRARIPPHLPGCNCAKQTQFPYGHGMPCPYRAKRTQSQPPLSSRAPGRGAKRSGPKSRDPSNHHRRRRFLTIYPQPQEPKYAKRTQFPYRPRTAGVSPASQAPIAQNKPNFDTPAPILRPTLQICKTNPIPPSQQPIAKCQPLLCETNPISPRRTTQIRKTNPMCPTTTVPPPPISAKRTQSTVSPPAHDPIMRNEPNLPTTPVSPVPPSPENTKRTQLPPGEFTKRTQSTVPPPSHDTKIRNEPNFRRNPQSTNYQPELDLSADS